MPRPSSLSKLTIAQLDRLIEQAKRNRDSRGSGAENLAKKVRAMAQKAGVGIDDLITALGAKSAKRPGRAASPTKRAGKTKRRASQAKGVKIQPKYRHPDDKTLTWSGRGAQARWISAWLKEKKGRKLDELLIEK